MLSCKSNPKKYQFAKGMRNHPMASEDALWQLIRRKQLGMKFRRQYVAYGYILDFYQIDTKLAVEVDGSSHFGRNEADALRDKHLAQQGITTLRLTDTMVMETPGLAIELILKAISG